MKISKLAILSSFLQTKHFTSLKKLKQFQEKRLHKILSNHKNRFYPQSLSLQDYPIIDKAIFMANFDRINTIGISEKEALDLALKAENSRDFSPVLHTSQGDIVVGLSSGTSGSRGIFLLSQKECAMWAGYILKRMLPKPYFKKRKIAFFLRADSHLYHSVGSRLINFKFYDLFQPLSEHIKTLNEQNPDILIMPANALKRLIQMPNLHISPQKIISVAEVLEDDAKIQIEQYFKQKVFQAYQCTEGFLAHTCEYGNLHLNEDAVYIEYDWIDKKSERFCPIITDLNRQTQPVIRYRLNDILTYDSKPCPCGSVFTRIKKIEGRCDDILIAKNLVGENFDLYPDFVRNAIVGFTQNLQEFRVEQDLEYLKVYIQPFDENTSEQIKQALNQMAQNLKIIPFKLKFFPYHEPPLHQKFRRIQKIR
ncbi:MAG: adenylate synthase [Campylobacter sp.]|nr:adenylate synthase [Campylobacter sp.]